MKMLNKLRNLKKDKKGFTLIEIVIVIVIIAILAAMLVPSLLRWVDNANQKSFLEAANTIKTSVLTELTEKYATTGSFAESNIDWAKVSDLVGKTVSNGTGSGTYKATVSLAGNKLDTLTVSNDSYTVTWNEANGKWGDVTSVGG